MISIACPHNSSDHQACVDALKTLRYPYVTTWPCLAEVFYMAGQYAGWAAQQNIWRMLRNAQQPFIIHALREADIARMERLMERYRVTPMDLADASLIVTAESLRLRQIFTTDSDFSIYRLVDGSALEIVPAAE